MVVLDSNNHGGEASAPTAKAGVVLKKRLIYQQIVYQWRTSKMKEHKHVLSSVAGKTKGLFRVCNIGPQERDSNTKPLQKAECP